jgi:hypothetical protein
MLSKVAEATSVLQKKKKIGNVSKASAITKLPQACQGKGRIIEE